MKEKLDGLTFRDMVIAAAIRIDENQQAINELNVFPVPDGDTGTNMSLTMLNARRELSARSPEKLSEACDVTASALLRGARGNSGVILSLLFRGFARAMKDKADADASEVAAALGDGVSAAYKAVMKPTEGTILTVSRLSAAAAAKAASGGADVEGTFSAALDAGRAALDRTIEQNPVLKKAGVVDAGGKGYIVILESMLAVVRGETVTSAAPVVPAKEKASFSEFETEDIRFAYCTEFIVARENKKDPAKLRAFLSGLGDSIVVVDDDEIIKVHVHNNCPGVVLTEALTYGSLQTVKIENMRNQHTEMASRDEGPAETPASSKPLGVIAVCAGAGLEGIFRELGADGIVSGGQTMNPSTEDLLREIERTPADTVIVLPNNKNIVLAANQCESLTDKRVIVIPTSTVPQGISAMLSYDPDGDPDEVSSAMQEMSSSVHTFSVTYAARDSVFDGLSMNEGDYLALIEGKLLTSGKDFDAIIPKLAEAISGFEPACVTVYFGEDVAEADAVQLSAKLAELLPDAEVQTLPGGQPVYYYIISAE